MRSSAANTHTYQTIPSNHFTGQYVADGLDGNYKMVLDYLNLPGSLAREAGVHQHELAIQLGIPLEQIMATLTYLVDEALIYNSVDDYHFKSAANSADTGTYQTIPSNHRFTGQYVADGLDGNYKMVLDYLNLPCCLARGAGVHQEELARQLGIPLDQIVVTLTCLVDEGLVYNSIDDYHFKSADTQTYQTIASNQFTGEYVADGPDGNYKMVLDYLNLPGSLAREAGVHQQELAIQLGIPLEQIMATLTYLVDEALVYNSIDNCHFKSAANSADTGTYQAIPSNHQFTGQYVADGHDGNYKLVLDYLNLPGSLAREAGVHQQELASRLGIPLEQIMITLICLVDEGLVYNSIDDYHFKSAANA